MNCQFYNFRLAVGSPRANDTAFDFDDKKTYRNTGAFYKCPISMNMEDCKSITSSSGSSKQNLLIFM